VSFIWRAFCLFGAYQLGVPRELQWLMPVAFLIIGSAMIIGSIISMISVATGRKRMKFDRLFEESKERLKDAGYVTTIRRLGYYVPDNMTSYYDKQEGN